MAKREKDSSNMLNIVIIIVLLVLIGVLVFFIWKKLNEGYQTRGRARAAGGSTTLVPNIVKIPVAPDFTGDNTFVKEIDTVATMAPQTVTTSAPESSEQITENKTLQDALKESYPKFVQLLGKNITDPKFIEAIRKLSSLKKIDFSYGFVSIRYALPTQNFISLQNTIKPILTNAWQVDKCLRGGNLDFAKHIVTSDEGHYIIDGHSRWACAYLLNPISNISTLDMMNIRLPMNALKSAELGVIGATGGLPTKAPYEDTNLFTVSKDAFYKLVRDTVTQEVVNTYGKLLGYINTPDKIAEFLWGNVMNMRRYNFPITGALDPRIMPQVEITPAWQTYAPLLNMA